MHPLCYVAHPPVSLRLCQVAVNATFAVSSCHKARPISCGAHGHADPLAYQGVSTNETLTTSSTCH